MTNSNLSIIQKTYDLIVWFVPRLERMPANYRRTLGTRVEDGLYDLLDRLVRARYQRQETTPLDEANAQLDVLRYQVRLLRDFEILDSRRYEHASRLINDIGTELGAWRRYRAARAA